MPGEVDLVTLALEFDTTGMVRGERVAEGVLARTENRLDSVTRRAIEFQKAINGVFRAQSSDSQVTRLLDQYTKITEDGADATLELTKRQRESEAAAEAEANAVRDLTDAYRQAAREASDLELTIDRVRRGASDPIQLKIQSHSESSGVLGTAVTALEGANLVLKVDREVGVRRAEIAAGTREVGLLDKAIENLTGSVNQLGGASQSSFKQLTDGISTEAAAVRDAFAKPFEQQDQVGQRLKQITTEMRAASRELNAIKRDAGSQGRGLNDDESARARTLSEKILGLRKQRDELKAFRADAEATARTLNSVFNEVRFTGPLSGGGPTVKIKAETSGLKDAQEEIKRTRKLAEDPSPNASRTVKDATQDLRDTVKVASTVGRVAHEIGVAVQSLGTNAPVAQKFLAVLTPIRTVIENIGSGASVFQKLSSAFGFSSSASEAAASNAEHAAKAYDDLANSAKRAEKATQSAPAPSAATTGPLPTARVSKPISTSGTADLNAEVERLNREVAAAGSPLTGYKQVLADIEEQARRTAKALAEIAALLPAKTAGGAVSPTAPFPTQRAPQVNLATQQLAANPPPAVSAVQDTQKIVVSANEVKAAVEAATEAEKQFGATATESLHRTSVSTEEFLAKAKAANAAIVANSLAEQKAAEVEKTRARQAGELRQFEGERQASINATLQANNRVREAAAREQQAEAERARQLAFAKQEQIRAAGRAETEARRQAASPEPAEQLPLRQRLKQFVVQFVRDEKGEASLLQFLQGVERLGQRAVDKLRSPAKGGEDIFSKVSKEAIELADTLSHGKDLSSLFAPIVKGADEAGQSFGGLGQLVRDFLANFNLSSASRQMLELAATFAVVSVAIGALVGAALIAAPALIAIGVAGIKVNSQMEQTRLGIASVVAAVGNLKTSGGLKLEGVDALNAALPLADRQLQKLRIDALQTSLTFEQISAGFLQAVGPGLAAGLNLDQIRKTVVDVSQLIVPLTGHAEQLGQELRAIFSGDINQDTQVARALGITRKEIEAAKEAGTLADLLNTKLKSAAATGQLMAQTFEAATSNLQEAGAVLAGTVTDGLFKSLRDRINNTLPQIFTTAGGQVNIAPAFKGVADTLTAVFDQIGTLAASGIDAVINGAKALSAIFQENRKEVEEIVAASVTLVGTITGIIGSVIRLVAGFVTARSTLVVISGVLNFAAQTLRVIEEKLRIVVSVILAIVKAVDAVAATPLKIVVQVVTLALTFRGLYQILLEVVPLLSLVSKYLIGVSVASLRAVASLATLETALAAARAATLFLFTTPLGLALVAASAIVAATAFGVFGDQAEKAAEKANAIKFEDVKARSIDFGEADKQLAQTEDLAHVTRLNADEQARLNAVIDASSPAIQRKLASMEQDKQKTEELIRLKREERAQREAGIRAEQATVVTAIIEQQRKLEEAERRRAALDRQSNELEAARARGDKSVVKLDVRGNIQSVDSLARVQGRLGESIAEADAEAQKARKGLDEQLPKFRVFQGVLQQTGKEYLKYAESTGVATGDLRLLGTAIKDVGEVKFTLPNLPPLAGQVQETQQQIDALDKLSQAQTVNAEGRKTLADTLKTLPSAQQAYISGLATEQERAAAVSQVLREQNEVKRASILTDREATTESLINTQKQLEAAKERRVALEDQIRLIEQANRAAPSVPGSPEAAAQAERQRKLGEELEKVKAQESSLQAARDAGAQKLRGYNLVLGETDDKYLALQKSSNRSAEGNQLLARAFDATSASGRGLVPVIDGVNASLGGMQTEAEKAKAALDNLFAGDTGDLDKIIDKQVKSLAGKAAEAGKSPKQTVKEFNDELNRQRQADKLPNVFSKQGQQQQGPKGPSLATLIDKKQLFDANKKALKELVEPKTKTGSKPVDQVKELTRAVEKLRQEVNALQAGGGKLFELELQRGQLEETKSQLTEILKLRRLLGQDERKPLPLTKEGREETLRDLNREKQTRESIIKLADAQKEADAKLRVARAAATAPVVSSDVRAQTAIAEAQRARRDANEQVVADTIAAQEKLNEIEAEYGKLLGEAFAKEQSGAVQATLKAKELQIAEAARTQLFQDGEIIRQRAAEEAKAQRDKEANDIRDQIAKERERAAFLQDTEKSLAQFRLAAEATRLKDSNDAVETIRRNEAFLTAGLISLELDLERARSEQNKKRVIDERATAIELTLINDEIRRLKANDPAAQGRALQGADLSRSQDELKTLQDLVVLQAQAAQGFDDERTKQDALRKAEVQRYQDRKALVLEAISLEEQIAHAGEDSAERQRVAYLRAQREIQSSNEKAADEFIANQVKLQHSLDVDPRRLNDGVAKLLASQKTLQESLQDFRTNSVQTVFDGISDGIDKLTAKFGAAGKAVSQLLKDLAKLALSKLFEKLFGINNQQGAGFGFGGGQQQQQPGGGIIGNILNFGRSSGAANGGGNNSGGPIFQQLLGLGGGGQGAASSPINFGGGNIFTGLGFGSGGAAGANGGAVGSGSASSFGIPGLGGSPFTGGFAGGNPAQTILQGGGQQQGGIGGLINRFLNPGGSQGQAPGGGGLLSKIPFIGKLFGGGGAKTGIDALQPTIGGDFGAGGAGLSAAGEPLGGGGILAGLGGLGASGLLAGGGILGSLAGGDSQIGKLLGGVGGTLLAGAAGATGIFGGAIGAALPALFSNPITAIIGGALIGGALLFGFLANREFNKFKDQVNKLYKIKVDGGKQGKGLFQQVKQIGDTKYAKDGKYKKHVQETLALKEVKDILAQYGESTGQTDSPLVKQYIEKREFTDQFAPANQFVKRANGGVVPTHGLHPMPYFKTGFVPVRDQGRDTVLTALRGEEYVTRPEITRREGIARFDALNRGQARIITLAELQHHNMGGYITRALTATGYADGGEVGGSSTPQAFVPIPSIPTPQYSPPPASKEEPSREDQEQKRRQARQDEVQMLMARALDRLMAVKPGDFLRVAAKDAPDAIGKGMETEFRRRSPASDNVRKLGNQN